MVRIMKKNGDGGYHFMETPDFVRRQEALQYLKSELGATPEDDEYQSYKHEGGENLSEDKEEKFKSNINDIFKKVLEEDIDEDMSDDQSLKLTGTYQILVDCVDEIEQTATLETLLKEGLKCRALNS